VRQGLGQSRGRELPPGFALLHATQSEITIAGKTAKVYHLLQDNGVQGYVGVKGQRFRVALDNATPGPLSVHWHGLILPNGQDGVPYVTQRPLAPGERRLYDFPLEQAGTYWMHSHWGLQEQSMMAAPLILREPSGTPDEHDVVMMLNDFTARDPAAILADLEGRGQGAPRPGSGRAGMTKMPAMSGMAMAGPDLNDVTYDAFHCHLLYHQAAGMMTVLRCEGFDDPAYDPRESLAEFKHSPPPPGAHATEPPQR
jgi:FtsP/CotA-like multicopper oxidase with cupredoxin domain